MVAGLDSLPMLCCRLQGRRSQRVSCATMLPTRFLCRFAAMLAASTVHMFAADQLVVIGDSLSKEYQITFPGVPAAGVDGIDVTNPAARNWSEILSAQRNVSYDQGIFKTSLFDLWTDFRLLGHEYNWALPGVTARNIRNLLTGQDQGEIASDPDVAQLAAFAPDWTATGARIAVQLQTTAEGAVIFCGGNDLRFGNTDPSTAVGGTNINYGTIYDGDGTGAGNPQPLMDSVKASIKAAANFVRAANPAIPLAVCAVPHVGCAPTVKAVWPADPIKTTRITAALDALNMELKTWTENTLNAAWVETPHTLTKFLLDHPLYIGGVSFVSASDPLTSGATPAAHNRYLFSHDGFHPGTAPQALIAQGIHAALQAKYPARYGATAPLTDRDVVVTICGIPANTGFTEFMADSGAAATLRAPLDDPDHDGLMNIVEFALSGMAPNAGDIGLLPTPIIYRTGATPVITLTWTPRYESNIFCTLVCQKSPDLQAATWTDVDAAQVTLNADGSHTARVPAAGSRVFLRLLAVVTP